MRCSIRLVPLALARLSLCLVLAEACQPGDNGPKQVSEHHPKETAAPQSVAMGGDCTAGGGPQCQSSLCLHTSMDPNSGYVCSTPCQVATDCPTGWTCAQFYPSADGLAWLPAPAPQN
jgi:hypothetical protein